MFTTIQLHVHVNQFNNSTEVLLLFVLYNLLMCAVLYFDPFIDLYSTTLKMNSIETLLNHHVYINQEKNHDTETIQTRNFKVISPAKWSTAIQE